MRPKKIDRYQQDKKRQRGSITVEASLSMVLFTFVMIALLSVINVCRVQATIANAMDLTALEISQYSYLYQVLGVRSGMDGMNEAGEPANKNIHGVVMGADDILFGVETMFTLLEEPTQAPGVMGEAKGYIEKGIDGISLEIDSIIENPKQFVLSFGALAISAGVDEIEKKLVKMMCVSHIGNGQYAEDNKLEDADKLLKALGVKGGVSGLDFRLTNLFDGESRQDVNLVVTYEARLFSPFPWLEKEFIQSATTKAWLSGDEQYVYADKPEETPPGGGAGTEESTEESTEETNTEEQTSEEATEEDKNTKYWEMSNIERGNNAKEDFRQSYPNADMTPSNKREKFVGYDEDTCTLYGINTVDTWSKNYLDENGKFDIPSQTDVKDYAEARIKLAVNMKEIQTENGVKQLDPDKARHVSTVIVIPENADPGAKARMEEYCRKLTKKLMKQYENSTPPVTISFQVQTGLGNSPNAPL